MSRALRIALAAAAVAAAAGAVILVNLVLLGYAQPRDDPLGKLSPRVTPTSPVSSTPASPPPAPQRSSEREHDD